MTREEREKRERLRATFDQAAELYERTRPGYPPALFDDLAAVARFNLAGSRRSRSSRPHSRTGRRRVSRSTWSGPTTFLEPGDSGSVAAGR
jgi:hypothetical protein